jgi:hypothetical protein
MAGKLTLMASPIGGWCVARDNTYLVRFVGPDAHHRALAQVRELTALFRTSDSRNRVTLARWIIRGWDALLTWRRVGGRERCDS